MIRLASLILLCAATIDAWAQNGTDLAATKANLAALERLWNEAQLNRDSAAIAAMIGDRFVNTEFDGEVTKRGQFLADFADPKFKPSLTNVQNLEVEVYGSTAIVTGDYHVKGVYGVKPYDHVGRFTDTWIFQDGKWLCIASHTSLKK
jgi:ketosteroid isomerase-like protein